jgi:hypothetical protein
LESHAKREHGGTIAIVKLVNQTLQVLRVEARFFVHFPQLLWAPVFVTLLPALYATIYLSSVWDSAGNAGALPVGLVNLNQGVRYREHGFNIGQDIVSELRAEHNFGYVDFSSENEAYDNAWPGPLAFCTTRLSAARSRVVATVRSRPVLQPSSMRHNPLLPLLTILLAACAGGRYWPTHPAARNPARCVRR